MTCVTPSWDQPTWGPAEVLELSQLFLASGELHLSRSSPPCSRLHHLTLALGRDAQGCLEDHPRTCK